MRQEARPFLSRPIPAALFLFAALIVAAAAVLSWVQALQDRSRLVTGGARWIWFSLDIDEPKPLRFYAERDFSLDAVPTTAEAKLFVDRVGGLTVNRTRFAAAEQRAGDPLRILQIAPALVAGTNRVVVEAESPTGAGGILFFADLGRGRSLVSDGSWRVSLSQSALARGGGSSAAVWGRPPMYPWGYPRVRE